jgi:hypothetical protein
MAESTVGRVLAIAVRGPKTGPMRELERVALHAEGGLAGDAPATSVRGITLLASRQWRQVQEELGVELPWHTRRANVLIEADSLAHLMKKSVRLGPVPVRIHAETKPCGLMDELASRPARRADPGLPGRGLRHDRSRWGNRNRGCAGLGGIAASVPRLKTRGTPEMADLIHPAGGPGSC